MKRLLKEILDPILLKFNRRIKFLNKQLLNQRKEEILNSFQSVGELVRLNGETFIFNYPQNIIVGNNVHIGNNAFFHASGGLIIGDNTHISRNVTIYTVNHNYKGKAIPYDNDEIHKPVFIGKNVWIGMNVSIIPGISIGEGAIIGMGTVVNRDVKPLEIVGMAKIEKIGERESSHYHDLNLKNSIGGINGKILSNLDLKKYRLTYHQNKERPIIFVLSTGRAGSSSIVHTLNQHPDCKAFHEDISQLIRLSTQLAYTNDKDKIYSELKIIFENKIWQAQEEVIVHSDQRLWNFIPFLSKYFPNSKFVHLIRNPKDSIVSMASRNWYAEDEYFSYNSGQWAKYRLQADKIGEYDTKTWTKMSKLAKCTWYWFYINEQIERELSKLDKERVLRLNLKDLSEKKHILGDFVGLGQFDFTVSKENKRKSHHEETYKELVSTNFGEQIEIELKKYSISFSY